MSTVHGLFHTLHACCSRPVSYVACCSRSVSYVACCSPPVSYELHARRRTKTSTRGLDGEDASGVSVSVRIHQLFLCGATDGAAVGATDGAADGALVGPYVDGALLGPDGALVGPTINNVFLFPYLQVVTQRYLEMCS